MHKVVFVGEAFVGKTAIIRKFKTSQFEEETESTIGAANCILPVEINPEVTIPLDVWDTAGQERYKSLTPLYFQNAEVVVFVFDLTNASTLEALSLYVEMVQQKANNGCGILLVGNKKDLEDAITIRSQDIEKYRERFQAFEAIEASAKTGECIDEIFVEVGKFIYQKQVVPQGKQNEVPNIAVNVPEKEKSDQKGCC